MTPCLEIAFMVKRLGYRDFRCSYIALAGFQMGIGVGGNGMQA